MTSVRTPKNSPNAFKRNLPVDRPKLTPRELQERQREIEALACLIRMAVQDGIIPEERAFFKDSGRPRVSFIPSKAGISDRTLQKVWVLLALSPTDTEIHIRSHTDFLGLYSRSLGSDVFIRRLVLTKDLTT